MLEGVKYQEKIKKLNRRSRIRSREGDGRFAALKGVARQGLSVYAAYLHSYHLSSPSARVATSSSFSSRGNQALERSKVGPKVTELIIAPGLKIHDCDTCPPPSGLLPSLPKGHPGFPSRIRLSLYCSATSRGQERSPQVLTPGLPAPTSKASSPPPLHPPSPRHKGKMAP